jgi:isopentenyl diphosphate isomerase/L-lactate dehydrogenase-like FMN-dependent dehydrogenase
MIGRASLWGMAANGEKGVNNVLVILRDGLSETLYGLGKSSIHQLSPDDLLIPADFTRSGNKQ